LFTFQHASSILMSEVTMKGVRGAEELAGGVKGQSLYYSKIKSNI